MITNTKLKFGLILGLNNSFASFSSGGNTTKYLNQFNKDTYPSISPGLSLDILFPINRNKFYIRNEFLYQYLNISGNYTDQIFGQDNMNYNYFASYSFITYNLLLRYNFLFPNVKFFVNGGIGLCSILNSSNEVIIKTLRYSREDKIEDIISVEHTKNFDYEFLIGAGLNFNRFSLESRYSFGRNVAKSYSSTNLHINTLSLYFSYTL